MEQGWFTWALEGKWDLDDVKRLRRQRNGCGLDKVIEEAGRQQALGVPAATGLGSRLHEKRTAGVRLERKLALCSRGAWRTDKGTWT